MKILSPNHSYLSPTSHENHFPTLQLTLILHLRGGWGGWVRGDGGSGDQKDIIQIRIVETEMSHLRVV